MIVNEGSGRRREIRWTAKRKARVVLDVLAGVTIDSVAQEQHLDVADVVAWREQFIRGGTESLKSRSGQPPQS